MNRSPCWSIIFHTVDLHWDSRQAGIVFSSVILWLHSNCREKSFRRAYEDGDCNALGLFSATTYSIANCIGPAGWQPLHRTNGGVPNRQMIRSAPWGTTIMTPGPEKLPELACRGGAASAMPAVRVTDPRAARTGWLVKFLRQGGPVASAGGRGGAVGHAGSASSLRS
jgi:hypothetical protein